MNKNTTFPQSLAAGRILAAIVMAIFTIGVSAVQAGNLGIANDFNAFIFGNANTTGGHADGSVAVGGSWTGEYELKQKGAGAVPFPTIAGASNVGAYVGNVLTGGNIGLRSLQGSIYYGTKGANAKLEAQNGFGVYAGANASIFTQSKSQLTTLSTMLTDASSLTINTSDQNNINVNVALNTSNGNLNVYNLNAANMTGSRTLNFSNVTANDTIVINVYGETVNWDWSMNGGIESKVLWNFVDAKTININSRDFSGSILALNATVNQYKNINGTLIANNWNAYNSSELHFNSSYQFSGDLPGLTPIPVPEPGSIILAVFGFLILFGKRRRTLVSWK